MAIASFDFRFPGFVGEGRCDLTIDTALLDGRPTVVCSQKRNYSGTSITNALEDIAKKLYVDVAKGGLDTDGAGQQEVVQSLRAFWKRRKPLGLRALYGREAVRWVEHYPAGTGLGSGDSFREVLFDGEDSPLWQPQLNLAMAESRFGKALIEQVVRVTRGGDQA